MTEEPGILGNLPRSRPGRRSARRAGAAGAPGGPGGQPERGRTEAGGSRASSREEKRPGREPESRREPASGRERAPDEPEFGGLVSGAARAAGGAATAGVRVASRLAGGALRRLPRP